MISRGLVQRVAARDGFRYQAGRLQLLLWHLLQLNIHVD